MNLWDRGNASDYELEGPIPSTDGHTRTIQRVKELLIRRNQVEALDLITQNYFKLYYAHNHFADEFIVLLFEVPLSRYEELRLLRGDAYSRRLLGSIADIFNELGIYIRIIAVEIADDFGYVQPPEPSITLEAVERALVDAELLLAQSGPVSAMDRVHTALHGYLLDQCRRAEIDCAFTDPSSARLFGLIKDHHPAFAQTGPWASQMTSLLRGLGSVVSILEPLRNRGSIAHPNEALLGEAEAMLFINCARTLLHYFVTKIQGSVSSNGQDLCK
jgi:Abortive infection C-terminus